MKIILLVVFSPLGSHPASASEKVAKELNGKMLSGYKIHSIIIPATIPQYDRGLTVLEEALRVDAVAIICLGISSGNKGLCIETCAVNMMNDKSTGSRPIDSTRFSYAATVEINLRRWNIDSFIADCANARNAKNESLPPLELSKEAREGVCNHLMIQICVAHSQRRPYADIDWILLRVPTEVADLERILEIMLAKARFDPVPDS